MVAPSPAAVPSDLIELQNWVVWKYERRGTKPTKVPYALNRHGASSVNPSDWTSYEDAANFLASSKGEYNGVGFVFFPDDGIMGIDIDDCLLSPTELKPWAQPIIQRFAFTFMEVSPSGNGIKIWCRGKLPGSGVAQEYEDGRVELYDRARYFTFTGNVFRGAPLDILPSQADVDWLLTLIGYDAKPISTLPALPKRSFDMAGFIEKHIKPLGWQVRGPYRNPRPDVGGVVWRIEDGCPFQREYDGGSPTLGVTAKGAAVFRCYCGDHDPHTWHDLRAALEPIDPQAPLEEVPEIDGMEPPEDFTSWHDLLHLDSKRKPRPVLINADIALRYSPEWIDVVAYDEFKQKVVVTRDPPILGGANRVWSDEDDTRTSVWMQVNGIYVGNDIVSSAIRSIAREKTIHPVRKYLKNLHWDGDSRVNTWLITYLGAKIPEDAVLALARRAYLETVGRMWLVSAVARIMEPGCKADHMLVLEGSQGIKKSSALRILASPEFFCDSLPDVTSKDAAMQTAGSWIIEWAELDGMTRSETTSVKAFISRQVEKIRPPYGRNTIEFPRQCVFAGTTNTSDYLRDETGNRRFWPVACTEIDIISLARDRNQLWAEAVALYETGSIWWPSENSVRDQIALEQEDRIQVDPWFDPISSFVNANGTVAATIPEILGTCLKIATQEHDQRSRARVGEVLRALGFRYKTWRDKHGKRSGYTKLAD